jgi:type IV pilus modification protein PilV
MRTPRRSQSGFFLIEALVAILIFSLGILGMVAIGGTAMGAQTDARYRSDAAALADEMASAIVMNVARNSAAAFTASLLTFQHRPGGANCNFNGANSAEPNTVAWLARVGNQGVNLPGLPNAAVGNQQILIDTSVTGFNRVEITVCWQAPNDQAMRQHKLVTYINGIAPPT